jgi:hypothetical protein
MGCNCNKRNRTVQEQEQLLADRAARIASATMQMPVPTSTAEPTWSPANGPRPQDVVGDTASQSG